MAGINLIPAAAALMAVLALLPGADANHYGVDFAVTYQISAEFPAWEFRLLGDRPDPREIYIHSLIITDENGGIIQTIDGLHAGADNIGSEIWGWQAGTFSEENMYGLRFADFNFDGYTDIALQYMLGGSARNEPSYFWLWDSAAGQFVRNAQLQFISADSAVFANPEERLVKAQSQVGVMGHAVTSYIYHAGEFRLIRREETFYYPGHGLTTLVEEFDHAVSETDLLLPEQIKAGDFSRLAREINGLLPFSLERSQGRPINYNLYSYRRQRESDLVSFHFGYNHMGELFP